MAAEEVLKLFESHWFGHETSTTNTPPPPQEPNPFLEVQEQIKKPKNPFLEVQELFKKPTNLFLEVQEHVKKPINPFLEVQEQVKKPNLSHLPTLHIRSSSDDHSLFSKTSSCSFTSDQYSFSPNSVLATTPRLQTIVSGKVMKEKPPEEAPGKNKFVMNSYDPRASSRRIGRRKKKVSKSLSELEFDELKGFMDLGFVFSEEDKDSSLVSIIPGLQRFGSREEVVDDDDGDDHAGVSRPYLSEAWEVYLEQRKKEKALRKNLRIPALGNEMDMKDHLKFWAHTVASTVR